MSKSDKEGKTHRGKPLPLDDDEPHSAGNLLRLTALSVCSIAAFELTYHSLLQCGNALFLPWQHLPCQQPAAAVYQTCMSWCMQCGFSEEAILRQNCARQARKKMERMMKNMESMTVKKAVLKRVAMMMMMTMMLPVRKAIKNDAAWPLHHSVMLDAFRQCHILNVKLLTDWITQCYTASDLLIQYCLPYALHGKPLHNEILISQAPRACCMKEYHQNSCWYRSSHVHGSSLVMYKPPGMLHVLKLLLGTAQLAFTCAVF